VLRSLSRYPYLLADVEVVATYKLHNLSRIRLENIFTAGSMQRSST